MAQTDTPRRPPDAVSGTLLDEQALTLDELAQACAVEPDWVIERVRSGILLGDDAGRLDAWRFASFDLLRARRLLQIERDFDANEDVAALVVDLCDEIGRLRARLRQGPR